MHLKQETNSNLIILVLSRRDAFESREAIRNTWAFGETNVFFLVGEEYCSYPPEGRMSGACQSNGEPVSAESLEKHRLEEEQKTADLRKEPYVVLLPSIIDNEDLPTKIRKAYKWALDNTNANWIVHVFDDSFVRVQSLKTYIVNIHNNLTLVGPEELNCNVLSKVQLKVDPCLANCSLTERNILYHTSFSLGSASLIVSRSVVKYLLKTTENAEHHHLDRKFIELCINAPLIKQNITWTNSDVIAKNGNCFDQSKLIIHNVSSQEMNLCNKYPQDRHKVYDINGEHQIKDRNVKLEMPQKYLSSYRFDLIIKSVYAYLYSKHGFVPRTIQDAYREHIRLCNNFLKNDTTTIADFVNAFHETINEIQKHPFVLIHGRSPVYPGGYPGDDTHRIAAAIALSKKVTVGYLDQNISYSWNYFLESGYSIALMENVLLEWMNIQRKLVNLTKKVFILNLLADKTKFNDKGYDIFKRKCSLDKGILYEKSINVNRHGLIQILRHMYGSTPWIYNRTHVQLEQMTSANQNIHLIFFFGVSHSLRKACKDSLRKLYYPSTENYVIYKSCIHIPDFEDQHLIIAEMVLNRNSLDFLNNAKNGPECQLLAEDIANIYNATRVREMPQVYPSRLDIIIDLDFVLHLFGFGNKISAELIFLFDNERNIFESKNQMNNMIYNFRKKSISAEHFVDQHLNENIKNKWDLFYDPANYGFCYGLKFLSLKR